MNMVGSFFSYSDIERIATGGKIMSLVDMRNKTILVTGAAGFIGSNLVKRICEENPLAIVIGIDNMND